MNQTTPRRTPLGWWACLLPRPLSTHDVGQCDFLRFPADFQLRRILRRFASASPLFPQENTLVRDPTRGAFFAECRTGSHGAALSSVRQTLPAASSGIKGSSAARIALAFSIAFFALANEASATPP